MDWVVIAEWLWTLEYVIGSFIIGLAVLVLGLIQYRAQQRSGEEQTELQRERNRQLARITTALEERNEQVQEVSDEG